MSKHSLFRLKITVGCLTSTYPSIHVETSSKSRSVDWRARVQAFTFLLMKTLSRSRSVVWCVVWCVVKLGTLSLALSPSSSLSHSLPLSFSFLSLFFFLSLFIFLLLLLLLFLLFLLFFFSLLFSPPNTMERTDQPTRRPTSRHLNVIWRRASAQQSVLSLLLSPPSSLLPLPSSKKKGTFLLQEYFRRGIYFLLQF